MLRVPTLQQKRKQVCTKLYTRILRVRECVLIGSLDRHNFGQNISQQCQHSTSTMWASCAQNSCLSTDYDVFRRNTAEVDGRSATKFAKWCTRQLRGVALTPSVEPGATIPGSGLLHARVHHQNAQESGRKRTLCLDCFCRDNSPARSRW